MTLLFVAAATRVEGADLLESQVVLPRGYTSFDEAITQLEAATDLKIACPPEVAETTRRIWIKGQFPVDGQEQIVKSARPAKELLNAVCNDFGLAWKFSPTTRTVSIDVPWRAADARSLADLLQAIWKPGQESEIARDEQWWNALDGLLCKEENFARACRARQRANLQSMFRLLMPERTRSLQTQMLSEAAVTSTSGARFQCLFIVRAMGMSPGRGCMDYYCFDDHGLLKIADVINTGHRMIVDKFAVYPRGRDGSEASEIRMVIRHNNGGVPRSLAFALKDHGLVLVDESGAGESLLKPRE